MGASTRWFGELGCVLGDYIRDELDGGYGGSYGEQFSYDWHRSS
jgi:hypothetical protein